MSSASHYCFGGGPLESAAKSETIFTGINIVITFEKVFVIALSNSQFGLKRNIISNKISLYYEIV